MGSLIRISLPLVALVLSTSGFAQDGQRTERSLRDVSNRALLGELERRLARGNGQPVSERATAEFFCDNAANLNISLIGEDQAETTLKVTIGTFSRCNERVAKLRRNTDIREPRVIAVCDSAANLHRFSMAPTGKLTELAIRNIGTFSRCEEEEKTINDK